MATWSVVFIAENTKCRTWTLISNILLLVEDFVNFVVVLSVECIKLVPDFDWQYLFQPSFFHEEL